jgi:ribosomal protein L16/L10AE
MIEALLAQKFPAPEYAFFEQVRNSTGFANNVRTADAIAIGLWPSRGHYIHGFEVKRSRGDWRRELADPSKADALARFCDFWYIVAPEGVVPEEEIPVTWGNLVVRKRKDQDVLVLTKKPVQLETPKLDRLFLAALCRRAHETAEAKTAGWVKPADVEAKVAIQVEAALDEKTRLTQTQLENARRDLTNLKAHVAEFEAASGIDIATRWNNGVGTPEQIGAAVKLLVRAMQTEHSVAYAADRYIQALRDAAANIENLRGALKLERGE